MRGIPGAYKAPPASAPAATPAPRLSSRLTAVGNDSVVAGADEDFDLTLICLPEPAGTGVEQGSCIGTLSLAFTGAPLTLSVVDPGTGGLACSAEGTVINCAVAEAIGARGAARIRLRPSPDARGTITVTTTAQGNFQFQPSTQTLDVVAQAKVYLFQTPDPTLVVAGATTPDAHATLVVVNGGPSALLNPKITETLPSSMDVKFPAPGICTFAKPTLHCDWDRLGPGERFSAWFAVSAPGWFPSGLQTATLRLASDPVSLGMQPQFFVAGDTSFGWQLLSDATPSVGADVTDHVSFVNVIPPGRTVASLTWALKLGNSSGLRVTKVETDDTSGALACQITSDGQGVLCAGPQVKTSKQGGAKITLHADAAGTQRLTLTWTTVQVSGQSFAVIQVLPASGQAPVEP